MPFVVSVATDGTEAANEGKMAAMMGDNGIAGFSLNFAMSTC